MPYANRWNLLVIIWYFFKSPNALDLDMKIHCKYFFMYVLQWKGTSRKYNNSYIYYH